MYHDRVHYMAAWNACVIRNHLRVIWNVHMLFFQGIHGNGKSQQRASLCCTRSTSKVGGQAAGQATNRREQWGREEEGARREREAAWLEKTSARDIVRRGRFWLK